MGRGQAAVLLKSSIYSADDIDVRSARGLGLGASRIAAFNVLFCVAVAHLLPSHIIAKHSSWHRFASANAELCYFLTDMTMKRAPKRKASSSGSKKRKANSGGRSAALSRLLEKLEEAEDLETIYASLKLIKEEVIEADDLSDAEHELIGQASLAVPYLMSRMMMELCTTPRSMGGLAFPHAKSEQVVSCIFLEGRGCNTESLTENVLVSMGLDAVDARKLLPKLKEVGSKAREKVEELRMRSAVEPAEHDAG